MGPTKLTLFLFTLYLTLNVTVCAKSNNTLSNKLEDLKAKNRLEQLKLKSKLKRPTSNRLPPFLKVCSRNDPNLNECVKHSIEHLRTYLANGIPQLGLPPCEPLVIPELIMNQGSGAVNVQSIYRNITIFGPSAYLVKAVRLDLDKKRIRVKIELPRLQLNADYVINGRILMMPISGVGKSEGNYTDIAASLILQAEPFQAGGREHLHISQVFTDFSIGHASLYLSGLFDGDLELGRAMNEFLNENWRNVAAEMKPILEETIAELFRKYANVIFHKYSVDQLFPE
ncbi:hypothetical protein M8J76_014354 [Diaphorina citri]|nr:hypothetical protein M8J75_002223 [Diaphorina citri]KAI5714288.1 hypothetical protein M8J76_014354 [Diaphorina citri]